MRSINKIETIIKEESDRGGGERGRRQIAYDIHWMRRKAFKICSTAGRQQHPAASTTCTCTLYAVSCTPPLLLPPSPLSAVPLSAQAVVGASEFKWQLSVASTAWSACCSQPGVCWLLLPPPPFLPPSPRLVQALPCCLVVAPCTSLCRTWRVCKSNYVEMNYDSSFAHCEADGKTLPLPRPPPPRSPALPLLISYVSEAKQKPNAAHY